MRARYCFVTSRDDGTEAGKKRVLFTMDVVPTGENQ